MKVYQKTELDKLSELNKKKSTNVFGLHSNLRNFIGCVAKPIIIVNDNLLFVHGGIIEEFVNKLRKKFDKDHNIAILFDKYNSLVKKYILHRVMKNKLYFEENNEKNDRENMPMWNNSLGKMEDNTENCNKIKMYNFSDMIIDHTPQRSKLGKEQPMKNFIEHIVSGVNYIPNPMEMHNFSDIIIGHISPLSKLGKEQKIENFMEHNVPHAKYEPDINSICNKKIHRIDVEMNYRGGKVPPQIINFAHTNRGYIKTYLIYNVTTKQEYKDMLDGKYNKNMVHSIPI